MKWLLIFSAALHLCVSPLFAADKPFIPDPAKFAPMAKARHLSGELVYMDAVNRRGGIRIDGGETGRYWAGPIHYFALLPYATIWQNGARAALRDLPLGTHMHGWFFLPPKGEEDTIPPIPDSLGYKKLIVPENHALMLADDFTHYANHGQIWKVKGVEIDKEKIHLEPAGKLVEQGIKTPYTFDLLATTRVWQDRRWVELKEIKPGTTVRFNLGWAQGGHYNTVREFTITELWLDEASWKASTGRQRKKHVRFQRQRWTPGWIEKMEIFDFGGGRLTIKLFEVNREIIEDLSRERNDRIAVACAEKTLRTWFHRGDRKFCKLEKWAEIKNPVTGSSGVQITLRFKELLKGYSPDACVRVKADSWKFVSMPPEERIHSIEEQKHGQKMVLPIY